MGGDLRVGDRLAAVVRVEVAAAEAMMVAGRRGGNCRSKRDGELGGYG